MSDLEAALATRERNYTRALDRLRELASADSENEAYDLSIQLNEAIHLVRCLRRLVRGRTVGEIHDAFWAPGDFGYETPIGSALDKLYRAGST